MIANKEAFDKALADADESVKAFADEMVTTGEFPAGNQIVVYEGYDSYGDTHYEACGCGGYEEHESLRSLFRSLGKDSWCHTTDM